MLDAEALEAEAVDEIAASTSLVKTPQYRVRKCVHEGKPRATNRSRVNPTTVQCKVGN